MNPLWLLAAGLWLASLFGVGLWQREAGVMAERVTWQAEQAAAREQALTDFAALSGRVRAREAQHAAALAEVSADYQQRLRDAKVTNDRVLADLRAGRVRLRQPVDAGGRAERGAGQAGTGTGGCDGGTAGELSPATGEFLWALAADADAGAEQLAACQQVIRDDRASDE